MSGKQHIVHVGFFPQDAEVIDFDNYHVTLLLDEFSHGLLPPHLRARFARIGVIDVPNRINVEDYDGAWDQMAVLVDGFVRDFGAPSAVVGLYEHTTVPAARLRERFGVPGTSLESAVLFRDKVLMKQALRGVVPLPRFWDVAAATPAAELEAIAATLPGPVVLKPKSQAASFGVRIFEDAAAFLRHARSEGIPDDHEVEEFVEGTVCHFDGLVRDGEIRLLSACQYIGSCFDFQYGREALGSVTLDDPELIARAHEFTDRVLRTLGLRDSSFHLEAFLTPGDELVFLEVANRFGGGYIRSHFAAAYGIELAAESLAACMNLPSAVTAPVSNLGLHTGGVRASGWAHPALQVTQRCRVKRIHGLDRAPDTVIASGIPNIGEVLNDGPGLFVGSGRFILAGENSAAVERDVRAVIDTYRVEVELLPDPRAVPEQAVTG